MELNEEDISSIYQMPEINPDVKTPLIVLNYCSKAACR